jgi:hypothetical protein
VDSVEELRLAPVIEITPPGATAGVWSAELTTVLIDGGPETAPKWIHDIEGLRDHFVIAAAAAEQDVLLAGGHAVGLREGADRQHCDSAVRDGIHGLMIARQDGFPGKVFGQLQPLAHGQIVGIYNMKHWRFAGCSSGNLRVNEIPAPVESVAANVEFSRRVWELCKVYHWLLENVYRL